MESIDKIMVVLTADLVIKLIYLFWLPAQIAHLIGFLIANRDDIYINKATFYLGDLISWLIMALASWLFVYYNADEWIIWLYYFGHSLILSTLLSDLFMHQESMWNNIIGFLKESFVESFAIPWGSGLIIGLIVLFSVGI